MTQQTNGNAGAQQGAQTQQGDPTTQQGNQQPPQGAAGGQAASTQQGDPAQGQQQKPKDPIPYERFKEVNDELAEFRRKETERAEKERLDAQAKAIADGKLQLVIDGLNAEIADLKPKAALVDELTTFVNTSIEAEIATWPEAVKAGDPGKERLQDRRAWVERTRPLVAKDMASGPKKPAFSGSGNKPDPAGADAEQGRVAATNIVTSQRNYSM